MTPKAVTETDSVRRESMPQRLLAPMPRKVKILGSHLIIRQWTIWEWEKNLVSLARPLRIDRPGGWYHVTARGNKRKIIFRDDRDRRHFLDFLAEIVESGNSLPIRQVRDQIPPEIKRGGIGSPP